MEGWIKIHRKLLDWEWFDDRNTLQLFIFILLKANYEEKKWHGQTILRGQLLTSVASLSSYLHLSSQSVRTSLNRLKSTNEITIKTTNKFTMITICKYDSYQCEEIESNKQDNKQPNKRVTNEQQTNNKQLTTTQEYKNIRNKEGKNIVCDKENFELAHPTLEDVLFYCRTYMHDEEVATNFFNYYNATNWIDANGNEIVNWKSKYSIWVNNQKKRDEAERIKQTMQSQKKSSSVEDWKAKMMEKYSNNENK